MLPILCTPSCLQCLQLAKTGTITFRRSYGNVQWVMAIFAQISLWDKPGKEPLNTSFIVAWSVWVIFSWARIIWKKSRARPNQAWGGVWVRVGADHLDTTDLFTAKILAWTCPTWSYLLNQIFVLEVKIKSHLQISDKVILTAILENWRYLTVKSKWRWLRDIKTCFFNHTCCMMGPRRNILVLFPSAWKIPQGNSLIRKVLLGVFVGGSFAVLLLLFSISIPLCMSPCLQDLKVTVQLCGHRQITFCPGSLSISVHNNTDFLYKVLDFL